MKSFTMRLLAALAATLFLSAALAQQATQQATQPATQQATKPATRPLDRVIAVINDEAVTAVELESRVATADQQLRRQKIAPPPRDVLQRQVLERMIIDRAQLQLAREVGVRVDDATVNAAIARLAEQNGMTLPAFRERLAADGLSLARFREDLRDDIILSRLRDREVESRIQVSEGEIDNFLVEQSTSDKLEYNISQILLRLPDNASSDRVEAVRTQAEDLMRQIRSGADFSKLAAANSAAPEALAGGELGWRSAERLPTLFVDAIKNLKQGQMAPLLRSPGGFHILRLSGVRNAGDSRLATGPVQQTRARHILLRVSEQTPEADVQRRLTDLRERVVKGGQDFAQLARLHSVDPSSTRGGDLGWLYPGDTVPEFERAMTALALNEISVPVATPYGWHLIQVLERRTEESPVERNRLAARQAIRERKAEEAYADWVRQLRDRTYVELRLDDAS
jgi:peptidyl-prolyl cis-trans isomerase SurA